MRLPSSRVWLGIAILASGPLFAQDLFERNLVVNGNAEAGPAAEGGAVVASIPGWTVAGSVNVVSYESRYSLDPTSIAPLDHGANYFTGGPNNAISTVTQSIDISAAADAIDAGSITFEASAHLGGAGEDNSQMTVVFADGAGSQLAALTLGPVTAQDRRTSGLYLRRNIGPVPPGTRSATVMLQLTRTSGSRNDGFADSLSLILHATPEPESLLEQNLIFNGDAEAAPAADVGALAADIPRWVRSAWFSVAFYKDGNGDLAPDSPGPDDRGLNYFWGGNSNEKSTAYQDIDVSAAASLIDQGIVNYAFSAWVGGYDGQDDNTTITAQFMDWASDVLGTSALGPVLAAERNNNNSLLPRSDSSTVPPGTRMVRIQMLMTRASGSDNDGLADNLALVFSVPE